MTEYPARVTLYDDGVYRWSYDMDMWHNHYMLKLLLKVMGIILGAILAVFIVLLGPSDAKALAFIAAIMAGLVVLALLIYAICALAMHGTYHLCFEMDDEAVALIQSDATRTRNETLGAVATLVGIAAGQPGQALRAGSTMALANSVGKTTFASVRRVRQHPKCDVIALSALFGMNQIYVRPEDYPLVVNYILERVPEKARNRS